MIDFDVKVFVPKYDGEKKIWIEETTLRQVVRDSAEETTSPKGVEPVLHVVENEDGTYSVCSWGVRGQNHHEISRHNTEDEATQEMYESWYECDYKEDAIYHTYMTIKELVEDVAEVEQVSTSTIRRWIRKYSKEKKREAEIMVRNDIARWNRLRSIAKESHNIPKYMRNIYDKVKNAENGIYVHYNYDERPTILHYPTEFVNDVKVFFEKYAK